MAVQFTGVGMCSAAVKAYLKVTSVVLTAIASDKALVELIVQQSQGCHGLLH